MLSLGLKLQSLVAVGLQGLGIMWAQGGFEVWDEGWVQGRTLIFLTSGTFLYYFGMIIYCACILSSEPQPRGGLGLASWNAFGLEGFRVRGLGDTVALSSHPAFILRT